MVLGWFDLLSGEFLVADVTGALAQSCVTILNQSNKPCSGHPVAQHLLKWLNLFSLFLRGHVTCAATLDRWNECA